MNPLNDTILEVMQELRNDFVVDGEHGEYNIDTGEITLQNDYISGEWVAIVGSKLNDGVYMVKVGDRSHILTDGESNVTVTHDESFEGSVYRLRLPRLLISVCKDIQSYNPSDIVSERVDGDYSVTFATGKNGKPLTWQEKFSGELDQWRNQFHVSEVLR